MSYIFDTHNTNVYMHFKLYFPGSPAEIYTQLEPKQLKCVTDILTKIHCIYPEYNSLSALDILNYYRKNYLFSNPDTTICEIISNCLSELINCAQQAEYERIGEIELLSTSDDNGESFNYVLPPTLKSADLPLYIQDWLEKKSQDNEKNCKSICAIFNKDGIACDAWYSNKFYINIKKNNSCTPEQILYGHRNCGIVYDTRLGFTNITYATGCCQYCKNTLNRDTRELCQRIKSYNNSYRSNYLPKKLCPSIWTPYKMHERMFQVNNKLGKPDLPPMIKWFMDEASNLITDNCDNERRYQYDSYEQIYFTGEHILMDEDELECAIYYPKTEKSYNTLCDSCLANWKHTRSILYDLITEWILIWGPNFETSIDTKYVFSTKLIQAKLNQLKINLI